MPTFEPVQRSSSSGLKIGIGTEVGPGGLLKSERREARHLRRTNHGDSRVLAVFRLGLDIISRDSEQELTRTGQT